MRTRRTGWMGLIGAMIFVLVGCGESRDRAGPGEPAGGAPGGIRDLGAAPRVPLSRSEALGPFLAEHWAIPVANQGPPPPTFSGPEASLDPATCGACHPVQFAQWTGSVHADAYTPGLAGQLIEGELSTPANERLCNSCHAPLGEQQPRAPGGAANPGFSADLQRRGVSCAGCHVRAHRRYGPPRRADAVVPEPAPHGGFEARDEFASSAFCAECHQFFGTAGINGKPVENTFVEWLESPQAAEGRTCQSCHMPDRSHTWTGIHDPDTVRAGVEFGLFRAAAGVSLVLQNTDVGHAFPTYVTPRVYLVVYQVSASGDEIAGTRLEAPVGREVDLGARSETFDTRVLPGESVRLDYAEPLRDAAVAWVGEVRIDPDFHYRGVYAYLLGAYSDAEALGQIRAAVERIATSAYVLGRLREPVDGEG